MDLAKQIKSFNKKDKIVDFLSPWPDLHEFVNKIFDCLQESSPQGWDLLSKAQRKSILKAARVSKKAKFIDDLIVAEMAWITELINSWLLKNNKLNPDLKAYL